MFREKCPDRVVDAEVVIGGKATVAATLDRNKLVGNSCIIQGVMELDAMVIRHYRVCVPVDGQYWGKARTDIGKR